MTRLVQGTKGFVARTEELEGALEQLQPDFCA